jgi:predicted HTH domain antitoxin
MAAITIDLPDTILNDLGKSPGEITRRVLEAVVLDGYRTQRLSRGEVRRLLGLSWQETEDFLAGHGLPYHYTADDLNEDRQNLDRLLGPQ